MKKLKIEKAYAKINLFLEVTGRRADGYHELDTVMQTVSLYDLLRVTYDPAGEGIALTCDKPFIPVNESNIAYKCAQAFLLQTGKKGGVGVSIKKRIPVAAGLGGGSADGAAVLRALNALTGAALPARELCALAASVGADIPFLVVGGCARARGIGEILEPVKNGWRPHLVIALGGRGQSTPAAYKALDEIGYRGERTADAMLAETGCGGNAAAHLYNAFERVVYEENEDAEKVKNKLLEEGARAAMLSGSGASVFGVFEGEKQAKSACAALRAAGCFAVTARPIGGNE